MRKTIIAWIIPMILLACNNSKTNETPTGENKMGPDSTETKQVELADNKYADMGKQHLQEFQSGNIDAWGSQFTDSAVYFWSGGDSVKGKQNIINYWKNSRLKQMDSVQFMNDIWLPIKINRPQRGPDMKGVWLLAWTQFSIRFKNGNHVAGWMHVDLHYNDNDQVDQVVQYIDRGPVAKAMGTK